MATVNKISDVLALFPGRSSDWRQVSASNHEVETNGTEFRKTALPTNFAAAADLRTEERAWLALGIVPRWDNGRLVVPKLGEPADFNGDPRDMTAMIDHVHAIGQGTRWSGDTIYDRALTKTLRRQTPKGASLVPEPAEFDHRDRLAHGDPHEDNWVRNARRGLLLVDWESAVRATPQEALGILWASLAQDHPDAAALIFEHVQNEKEFWHAAQCKAALTISWREWKNIESDAPRVIENFDHSAKLANKEVPWTYAWLT